LKNRFKPKNWKSITKRKKKKDEEEKIDNDNLSKSTEQMLKLWRELWTLKDELGTLRQELHDLTMSFLTGRYFSHLADLLEGGNSQRK
jgi:hypothetical protein